MLNPDIANKFTKHIISNIRPDITVNLGDLRKAPIISRINKIVFDRAIK